VGYNIGQKDAVTRRGGGQAFSPILRIAEDERSLVITDY